MPTSSSIPLKPDWTERFWERSIAGADRLSAGGAELARAALRHLFPPSLTETLRASRHPVVARQLTHAGRAHLLELGVATAILRPGERDVGRARHPDQFEGLAAELQAGFMFRRAGATLAPAPERHGRRRCEFIATFPDGKRLAVEAKLPDVSDDERDISRVECELLIALMHRFQWLSDVVPSGYATFRFAPGIAELGDRHGVDERELAIWVDEAETRLGEALARQSRPQQVEVGRVGLLRFREAREVGFLQFDTVGAPRDAKRRSRQLKRNLLNDGAKQIGESGVPGVIVMDIQRDGLVRNTIGFLAEWARHKASLAAVVVVDRLVLGDGLYGCVDLLPGPCFADARSQLSMLFEVCEDGHLHYNPLTSPGTPCPCDWLPRVA